MEQIILEAGGTMAFTFHVLFMLFNLFIIYQFYFNDKFFNELGFSNEEPKLVFRGPLGAVFLTFAYFGFRYIFFQSEKLFPIQFIEIYIKSFTVCCLFVFYTSQVEFREYYFVVFLFIVSIILHFASRNRMRSYFN